MASQVVHLLDRVVHTGCVCFDCFQIRSFPLVLISIVPLHLSLLLCFHTCLVLFSEQGHASIVLSQHSAAVTIAARMTAHTCQELTPDFIPSSHFSIICFNRYIALRKFHSADALQFPLYPYKHPCWEEFEVQCLSQEHFITRTAGGD